MVKAIWNGVVIGTGDAFEPVEGNVYFPPHTVRREFLKESETHTHCPCKDDAPYCTLAVDGAQNPDAAWYYPSPFEKAVHIKDHVAFWKGVTVECQRAFRKVVPVFGMRASPPPSRPVARARSDCLRDR